MAYASRDAEPVKLCLQTVLIKPEELEAHGIPVQKVVQHPGDFIINFPGQLFHVVLCRFAPLCAPRAACWYQRLCWFPSPASSLSGVPNALYLQLVRWQLIAPDKRHQACCDHCAHGLLARPLMMRTTPSMTQWLCLACAAWLSAVGYLRRPLDSGGLLCAAGAYHSGFNVGFNCAESTNFATRSWIQHGAVADFCRCSPHQQSVRLDMGLFLAQAPNDRVRRLVRARMAKDQAARGEPVDTISDMHRHGAGESDHDSSNLRHEEVKSRRVRKAAAAQATGEGKAAAQATAKDRTAAQAAVKAMKAAKATVKGKAAAKDAAKGKAPTQQGKLRAGGALQKIVKGVKQLKKALQPSKAQQGKAGKAGSASKAGSAGKAGTAGKAESKRLAATLKTAKRAELAPSAAAKLPRPKPAAPSPNQSPLRSLKGSGSPARARGRPRRSAKAPVAVRDVLMQAVWPDTPEHCQLQIQQPALLFPSQQQQQHSMPSAHQSPVAAEQAEAQPLGKGKRKRSTFTGAAPQDELTLGEAVQAIHQKTVQVVRQWMSGGRRDKSTVRQEQAAPSDTHQLPHDEPEQQVQQGVAQQATCNEQDQQSDQAGPIVHVQNLQPPQQAQQVTAGSEASNSGQDSCPQLQQSMSDRGQERSKRRRVQHTAAETAFTGQVALKHHRSPSCFSNVLVYLQLRA